MWGGCLKYGCILSSSVQAPKKKKKKKKKKGGGGGGGGGGLLDVVKTNEKTKSQEKTRTPKCKPPSSETPTIDISTGKVVLSLLGRVEYQSCPLCRSLRCRRFRFALVCQFSIPRTTSVRDGHSISPSIATWALR